MKWWRQQSSQTPCLSYSEANAKMVYAGQALLNTPAFLGGQAAKANLSCASCHANGRRIVIFSCKACRGTRHSRCHYRLFQPCPGQCCRGCGAHSRYLSAAAKKCPGRSLTLLSNASFAPLDCRGVFGEGTKMHPSSAALANYVHSRPRTCEGGAPQARTRTRPDRAH